MNKTIKSLIFSLFLSILLIAPILANAQTQGRSMLGTLNNVAKEGGYQTEGVTTAGIIGMVLGAFLGFLGLTFVILVVIAGYSWMTAQGNEETIKKSSATIKSALIGLVVCLSAWSLWKFIFEKLILGGASQ